MTTTKNYKQELKHLENGLIELKKNLPGITRNRHNKILILIEVQNTRIDFFKIGYNLCNRELKEQKKLQ